MTGQSPAVSPAITGASVGATGISSTSTGFGIGGLSSGAWSVTCGPTADDQEPALEIDKTDGSAPTLYSDGGTVLIHTLDSASGWAIEIPQQTFGPLSNIAYIKCREVAQKRQARIIAALSYPADQRALRAYYAALPVPRSWRATYRLHELTEDSTSANHALIMELSIGGTTYLVDGTRVA